MSPKRHIYILGDSISLHYGPYLQEYLKHGYSIIRRKDETEAYKNLDIPKGANGGNSRRIRALIKTRIAAGNFEPDILLINCGLHDIKRPDHNTACDVSINEYRDNLEAIVRMLIADGPPFAWIRTTPSHDPIHNQSAGLDFVRLSEDINNYNAVADQVMLAYGIATIDLYNFTANLDTPENLYCDHVHFVETARKNQGAYLAGWIESRFANMAANNHLNRLKPQ